MEYLKGGLIDTGKHLFQQGFNKNKSEEFDETIYGKNSEKT